MESITLYFKEGVSDKVYQASIEQEGSKFVVNIAYGRRGATLQTGRKTPVAVEYAAARSIWEKVVKEKQAKGYSVGTDGTPYQGVQGGKDTGIRPQLLNPVAETDLPGLLADDEFFLQPKMDGRRLLIRKRGGEITGINRKGLECGVPESIVSGAMALPGNFLVDGEAIGDVLHVFDLLESNGQDLRQESFHRRGTALLNLLAELSLETLAWVPCYRGKKLKAEAFNQYREAGTEGVVFKRHASQYSPGRPASGGNQLKFKFVETASVVVSAINSRRSAAISVLDGSKPVSAGNVTIPPDHPVPSVGQVAEVRYLYAMRESGALFQPVYLGVREDIDQAECLVSQLKYKVAA